MSIENQNFEVYPGDTHNLKVTISNQDNDMKPLPLAGAEFTWKLFKEPYSVEVLSKTSEDDQIQIVSSSEGIVKVLITPADTTPLKYGTIYTHKLVVRDSAGQSVTVMTGNCTIKK